jgi:hypothetical protein
MREAPDCIARLRRMVVAEAVREVERKSMELATLSNSGHSAPFKGV